MAYLFTTTDGTERNMDGESWKARQTPSGNLQYDGFVKLDILNRDDVLDANGIAGEALPRERECVLNSSDNKFYLAQGGETATFGSTAGEFAEGDRATVVYDGRSVNQVGEVDIAADTDLVPGPGGLLVEFQAAPVVLANAVASTADDDFLNGVWDAAGEKMNIRASADDASSRGAKITIHALDVDGNYVMEDVYLDGTDSSVEKQTEADNLVKLLAWATDKSFAAGNLIIEDVDNNACVNLATPANGIYGTIDMTASDAKGTGVEIVAGSAQTGTIRVVGTDKDDNPRTELITFTAEDTKKTALAYKTITSLMVGDDGVATQDYTVTVLANTADQVVGSTVFGAIDAGKSGVIKRA
jgi:hypothetical protein